jgi:hypothetical protein
LQRKITLLPAATDIRKIIFPHLTLFSVYRIKHTGRIFIL